jgi:predicted AAA+ superfamily ATPase
LSGELSTHLTGSYVKIELFPFSFSEILDYKKIKQNAKTTKELAFRRQAYFDYLKQGGFPEMFQIGETQKREYLRTLFQSIIFKDIVKRFNIKYIKTLLENIVFLELCRRRADSNYDIYYYNNNYEIDFVVAQNGKIQELIQISLTLENEKTHKREISALLKGADELRCNALTIITQDEKKTISKDDKTIEVVSVIDWLCSQ